jgi:L-aspartate oxidase
VRDLIVIGSGVAGLFTALEAYDRGIRDVLIITKAAVEEGATRYAQGGIAAAIDDGDSWELHEADTLGAGAELCDQEAVRVLVRDASRTVTELVRLGVPFDTEDGRFAYAREGAHSMPRVLHAGGDATGRHIERALAHAVRERGIEMRDRTLVTEIALEAGACRAVRLLDGTTIDTRAAVLATGGAGQLYSQTTNPLVSTGDGVALGLRAGAIVADLEFFQFHPTAFAGAGSRRFLISEAVRGHGAVLRNDRGEPFMARYDARAELAPRDIVARSMIQEMAKLGLPNVWLDATQFPAGEFAERFPNINAFCLGQGCDPQQTPIPVVPAAHYMMGGVWTDSWGRTSVPGLFACGETASTGVHGANRLASNSLLEGVVFGARVAQALTEMPRDEGATPATPEVQRLAMATGVRGTVPARDALQTLMWNDVGILRSGAGLRRAEAALREWADGRNLPSDPERFETANLCRVGWVMARAALGREESRGAHFRLDFPAPRQEWRYRQFFALSDA